MGFPPQLWDFPQALYILVSVLIRPWSSNREEGLKYCDRLSEAPLQQMESSLKPGCRHTWVLAVAPGSEPWLLMERGWPELLPVPYLVLIPAASFFSLPGWEPSQWRGHGEAVSAGPELLPAGVWEDVL